MAAKFIERYNHVRLHGAIGYIAPLDFMAGRAPHIWSERDRKLETARERRRGPFPGGARCLALQGEVRAVRGD